jgi:hypothetical protein
MLSGRSMQVDSATLGDFLGSPWAHPPFTHTHTANPSVYAQVCPINSFAYLTGTGVLIVFQNCWYDCQRDCDPVRYHTILDLLDFVNVSLAT